MRRRGTTLLEVVVALAIMGTVLIICQPRKQSVGQEWQSIERQINSALSAQRSTFYLDRIIDIRAFRNGDVWVGVEKINLPPGWRMMGEIKMRSSHVHPGTLRFTHKPSGQTYRMVFQLGGGSYEVSS